jgi:hypothetical protein
MPLHTLIELEPRPDGTMVERRYKINIDDVDDSKVKLSAMSLHCLQVQRTKLVSRCDRHHTLCWHCCGLKALQGVLSVDMFFWHQLVQIRGLGDNGEFLCSCSSLSKL